MAKPNYSYEKRQRELEKKRKKEEKALKKAAGGGSSDAEADAPEDAENAEDTAVAAQAQPLASGSAEPGSDQTPTAAP